MFPSTEWVLRRVRLPPSVLPPAEIGTAQPQLNNMGIRLHPHCKDSAVLEQLINVPEGTYERVQKLQAAEDAVTDQQSFIAVDDNCNEDSVGYLFHQIKESDPNLRKMSDFLLSGWGKFDLSLTKGDECVGGIDPGVTAQHMLVSSTNGQYFSGHLQPKQVAELSGGFYWL